MVALVLPQQRIGTVSDDFEREMRLVEQPNRLEAKRQETDEQPEFRKRAWQCDCQRRKCWK
jgi:hypothetical protein